MKKEDDETREKEEKLCKKAEEEEKETEKKNRDLNLKREKERRAKERLIKEKILKNKKKHITAQTNEIHDKEGYFIRDEKVMAEKANLEEAVNMITAKGEEKVAKLIEENLQEDKIEENDEVFEDTDGIPDYKA